MVESQTKNCQSCKAPFIIEPEDFDFYKKIDVPPPTWCPECRMQRRMAFAADSTTLYSRVCQAPGHSERIVSVYPEVTKSPVYDPKFWASDSWDPMAFGQEYDFSRSFFEQFKELVDKVPVRSTEVINSVNSDYCLGVTDSKNCYVCSGTFGSENCIYARTAVFCKDCVNVVLPTAVERGYDLFSVDKSFNVTSAVYSDELVNCDFMYDCRGCTDCLGCVGLRNKSYCIFNKQFSKKEYEEQRAFYDLGSYAVREKVKKQFSELLAQHPRKYAVIRNAPHSTGDNLINVKNCSFVFQALNNTENCKYSCVLGYGAKDCQDIAGGGLKSELLYDGISFVADSDVAFSYRIRNSRNIRYCRECFDSEYLFGCIGLKTKKYCILNKQYSKEDFFALREKIIAHMKSMPYVDSRGRTYTHGEFFPAEHSAFPYSSAWARQEFFPETKESALAKGFWWYDQPGSSHAVSLEPTAIPDHCKDAPESITQEVIRCMDGNGVGCTGVFKIIPAELAFYKQMNIALPRACNRCSFSELGKNLSPYKLWHRQCECVGVKQRTGYGNTGKHEHGDGRCANKFETAYQPGRPELLYCEGCYNKEIL